MAPTSYPIRTSLLRTSPIAKGADWRLACANRRVDCRHSGSRSMGSGMTGRHWIIACAASSLLAAGSMAADRAALLQSIQAGQSALKAKYYEQADFAFRAGLRAAPQQPRVAYMLAQAAYGRGDTQSVLSWLRRYVAMGVHGPHDLDADFPTLKTVPQFVALKKSFAEVAAPLCRCEEVFPELPLRSSRKASSWTIGDDDRRGQVCLKEQCSIEATACGWAGGSRTSCRIRFASPAGAC